MEVLDRRGTRPWVLGIHLPTVCSLRSLHSHNHVLRFLSFAFGGSLLSGLGRGDWVWVVPRSKTYLHLHLLGLRLVKDMGTPYGTR